VGPVRTNSWIHFAMVFDGTNQSFYLNGELRNSVAAPPPGPFDMRRYAGFGRGGKGLLRSARISSAVRYHDNFQPASHWTTDDQTMLLLEASNRAGNIVKDTSGQGRDAKVHGTPVYVTDSE